MSANLKPIALKNDSSSILYQLPPGKKGNLGHRVVQKPQKGNTCWFYAIKRLLTEGDTEQKEAFRFYSSIRKTITEHELSLPTLCYALEHPFALEMKHLDAQKIFWMLADWENCPLKKLEEKLVSNYSSILSVKKHLQLFLRDSKGCSNFYDYLKVLKFEENTIYDFSLRALGIHPKECYKKNLEATFCCSFEKLIPTKKVQALQWMVRSSLNHDCHLSTSTWTPTDEISYLISELRKYGPHFFIGQFGRTYYTTPFGPYKKIGERTIYAWQKDSPKVRTTCTHCIVVVGAEIKDGKALVYFIDPLDESDPDDVESQRIYTVSYKNFTSTVLDLMGNPTFRKQSPFGFSVHA